MPLDRDDRVKSAPSVLEILTGVHQISTLFDDFLRPLFVEIGRPTDAKPSASFACSGGRTDHVYFIQRGRFKIQQALRDGKCHIVGFAESGDLFGNPFSPMRHDCALVALNEGQLFTAPRRLFVEAVAREPSLLAILLIALANETRLRVDHGALLGRGTAEERVSTFLLEENNGRRLCESAKRFPVVMSRRDIADYVGLTVETVSRTLSMFKRDGLIDLPNSRAVDILDLGALEDFAGADVVRSNHSRVYF